MAALRWWAEKIAKQNVVARANDHYGIRERRYVTNESKARVLSAGDLAKIADPHLCLSLQLQAAFGLRREESLKIRPAMADRGEVLALQASWTKGGRRESPDPVRRTACRARGSEGAGRAGQPDSDGTHVRPATASLRASLRAGRHSSRARSSTPLRAGALPGTHRLAGTRSWRSEFTELTPEQQRAVDREQASYQHGTGSREGADDGRVFVAVSSYAQQSPQSPVFPGAPQPCLRITLRSHGPAGAASQVWRRSIARSASPAGSCSSARAAVTPMATLRPPSPARAASSPGSPGRRSGWS